MITCYTFNSITIILIGCIYSKSLLRHLHMGAGKIKQTSHSYCHHKKKYITTFIIYLNNFILFLFNLGNKIKCILQYLLS